MFTASTWWLIFTENECGRERETEGRVSARGRVRVESLVGQQSVPKKPTREVTAQFRHGENFLSRRVIQKPPIVLTSLSHPLITSYEWLALGKRVLMTRGTWVWHVSFNDHRPASPIPLSPPGMLQLAHHFQTCTFSYNYQDKNSWHSKILCGWYDTSGYNLMLFEVEDSLVATCFFFSSLLAIIP